MKTLIFSILSIFVVISNTNAQLPSVTRVVFADGGDYSGRIISETADRVKVEFLHSHSIYEFSNTGTIISSTGKYAKGQKVKAIMIRAPLKSVYNLSNISADSIFLGIKFGDGQVYFCRLMASREGSFDCGFTHTKSYYTMMKEGNVWRVFKTDRGTYPVGHVILDIYTLDTGRFFYDDGSNSITFPQELSTEN